MFFNDLTEDHYEVTLNSAHRIKSSVAQSTREVVSYKMPDRWNIIPISDLLTKDTQQIMDQLSRNWDKEVEKLQLRYAINIDLNRMKEFIFEANILSGVSTLLNQVKNLKFEQNMLKGYENEGNESVLSSLIDSLRSYYENRESVQDYCVIPYNLHEPSAAERRIKEINKEILSTEEKIAELNASHKLTITLYDVTAEKIGLK